MFLRLWQRLGPLLCLDPYAGEKEGRPEEVGPVGRTESLKVGTIQVNREEGTHSLTHSLGAKLNHDDQPLEDEDMEEEEDDARDF